MPNEATIENLNIEIEGTVSQSNTQAMQNQADVLNKLARELRKATKAAKAYAEAASALPSSDLGAIPSAAPGNSHNTASTPSSDQGASTAPIHYWTDSADNQDLWQTGSLGQSPIDWSAFQQEAQQQATAIQEAMTPDIDSLVSHFRGYDELVVRIDTAREKLTALLTSGKDVNDTGVQRLIKQIQKLQDELGKAGEEAEKSGEKAKKGTSGWQRLASSFKRVVLYRLIRAAIKTVTTAVNDGIKSVVTYSEAMGDADRFHANKTFSAYATQIEYIKNALGAALIPIAEALLPLFVTLSDLLVDIINAVNQWLRFVQGYKTYLKANKYEVNLAKQWETATKAAKEYQKVIAGFDELNILRSNAALNGTTGSLEDIKNAFQSEAPVDETTSKVAGGILTALGTGLGIYGIWKLIESGLWKVLETAIAKLVIAIQAWWPVIWGAIKAAFVAAWQAIKTALAAAWEAVKAFFSSLWGVLGEVLASVLPTIGAFAAILGILALFEQVPKWMGIDDEDKRNQSEESNLNGWSGTGRKEWTDNRTADLMNDSTSYMKLVGNNTADLERLTEAFNKKSSAKNAAQLAQAYQKQNQTLKTLKQQYEDLIEQQRILRQQGNDSDGVGSNLEELQTQIEHVAEQIRNATEAQEDAKDALNEAGYARLLATEANAEYLEGLKKTLGTVNDLKDAEQMYSDQSKELSGIRREINDILAKGDDLTAADIDRLAVLNQSLLDGEAALREIKKRLHEIRYESGEADTSVSSLISQLNSYKGKKIPIELAIEINAAATVAFDKSYQGGQAIIDEKKLTRAFLENPHIYDAIKQADLYASGGFVPRGDLFIANEQGAELVGRIGNQTAVANQTQIVDAVSAGVYRAMREAGGSGGETRIALMVDRKTLTEVVVDTINNTVRQTGASPLLV